MLICYAFDVDGVIVDVSERLRIANEMSGGKRNLFWRYFFSEDLIKLDKPRSIGINLVRDRASKGCIVVITGRPKRLRDVTIKEFMEYTGVSPCKVFMRNNRDYRSSAIIKVELISLALNQGFEIIEFHDDSEEVLRAVKEVYPWMKLYLHTPYGYERY